MPLAAGTRLGPNEIVSPLGAGGKGEVFGARDTRPGHEVALHRLVPTSSAREGPRMSQPKANNWAMTHFILKPGESARIAPVGSGSGLRPAGGVMHKFLFAVTLGLTSLSGTASNFTFSVQPGPHAVGLRVVHRYRLLPCLQGSVRHRHR